MLEKLKRLDDDDSILEELWKDDEAYDAFLAEVLQYANENKTDFEYFVQNLNPEDNSDALDIIYGILSDNSDDWEDFLLDEYKRWFELAETNPIYVRNLFSLMEIENAEREEFSNKIILFLNTKMEHPNNEIRHSAVWLIEDYLSQNRRYRKHPKSIGRLQKRLDDDERKVRLLTIKILKKMGQLPKYYKPRFMDRIALKMEERQEKKMKKFVDKVLKDNNIHL